MKYESADGATIITCAYDYMGRRFEKKVSVNGAVTLHERYLYRDYQQIAALDLLAEGRTLKHAILWDPTQPIATRPLAIQKDGNWFTYGLDLTKNITELFTNTGAIATTYTYTPYGEVRAEGEIDQPIQWSSEVHDTELGLIYYNYRYYNPTDGRWTRRDPVGIEGGENLYLNVNNSISYKIDYLGLKNDMVQRKETIKKGSIVCTCGTKVTVTLSAWKKFWTGVEFWEFGVSLSFSLEVSCDLSNRESRKGGPVGRIEKVYEFVAEWKERAIYFDDTFPNPVTGGFDRRHVKRVLETADFHIVPYSEIKDDTSYLCCDKQ